MQPGLQAKIDPLQAGKPAFSNMTTPKTDYSALDQAILARLKEGPLEFNAMGTVAEIRKAADHLEATSGRVSRWGEPKPWWRHIDYRLQALRKKGNLTHHDKQWHFSGN